MIFDFICQRCWGIALYLLHLNTYFGPVAKISNFSYPVFNINPINDTLSVDISNNTIQTVEFDRNRTSGVQNNQTFSSQYNDSKVIDHSLSNRTIKSVEVSNQSSLLSQECLEFGRKFIRISFVNGIFHSEDEWRRITEDLEATFGLEVRPFYNPSSGNWVQDATKAGYDLVVKPNDAETAYSLALHLRNILAEVAPNGRVLHIAHSGGAILTYLAAKYHLNGSETSRIDVITLGPGRSITRKYFQGRLVNYYAKNDPVVILDKRAGQLIRRTAQAFNWISEKLMRNMSYFSVRDAKHNTSFIFLNAILNNPIQDHSMYGPTYRIALEMEASAFRKRLEAMVAQSFKQQAHERNLIRKARKTAARITGMHHFWDQLSMAETLRAVRKYSANITNMHGYFSNKKTNQTIAVL